MEKWLYLQCNPNHIKKWCQFAKIGEERQGEARQGEVRRRKERREIPWGNKHSLKTNLGHPSKIQTEVSEMTEINAYANWKSLKYIMKFNTSCDRKGSKSFKASKSTLYCVLIYRIGIVLVFIWDLISSKVWSQMVQILHTATKLSSSITILI